MDNDCDGEIDEELTRDCSNACGAGVEVCSAGTWGGCDAPANFPETCDGEDNDCDGQVDDGVCEDDNGNNDDGPGGLQAGCTCSTGGVPDGGTFALLAVIALVVLRRRH